MAARLPKPILDSPVFGNTESTTWIVPRIFSLLFVPTRLIPSFFQNNVSTSRLIETFPSTCILDYRFLYGRNGCFSSTFEANSSRSLAPLLLELNRNRFLPTRSWRKPGKSARSRAMSWFTRDSSNLVRIPEYLRNVARLIPIRLHGNVINARVYRC